MYRYLFILMAATFFSGGLAHAGQYEASLLPERSLRYEAGFGLFHDDFDGFVLPRQTAHWDGRRLVSRVSDIGSGSGASLGYGRGVTGGWSWSVLGSGGYGYRDRLERIHTLQLIDSGDGLQQVELSHEPLGVIPAQAGEARLSLNAARRVGRGEFGLGLQGSWTRTSTRDVSTLPALFTFSGRGDGGEVQTSISRNVDTGESPALTQRRNDPLREDSRLAGALVVGYGTRPDGQGWGWAVDALGGVERLSRTTEFSRFEQASVEDGFTTEEYRTSGGYEGLSPIVGLALTLVNIGESELLLDLGGELRTGVSLEDVFAETVGQQRVEMNVGGASRVYTRDENRIDLHSGSAGNTLRATAGFRQLITDDPDFDLGWGVHATWFQVEDNQRVASTFTVNELFDADGDGTFSEGDVRAQGRGETTGTYDRTFRQLDIRMPVAMVIPSAGRQGLEYRLGSELRYRNRFLRERSGLTSLVVPSGQEFEGDGSSQPVRYGDALLPAGQHLETRDIDVWTTVRVGAGYWFTPRIKADVAVSAAPEDGERFVDLTKPHFGLSVQVAF